MMPRVRPPERIDQIADAATEVFIRQGYGPAKIAQIAELARVGPGTIYLYAEGKEGLFDLAIRRALEDPTVWTLKLPHPNPAPGAVADALWRCLQNAAHFPQLWLAADSPPPSDIPAELRGILVELFQWLRRYRRALKLIERSNNDWPELQQVFYRRFWRGGVRRVADYLERRAGEGKIVSQANPLAAAHLVVESLAWMAVHRDWVPDAALIQETAAQDTALALLLPALLGSH